MAINPIGNQIPQIKSISIHDAQAPKVKEGGFSRAMKNYVGEVDQEQKHAGKAIEDLLTGKTQDVLPVVRAVSKADLSFKLLLGVRNKMIDAYKQTMQMQI